MFGLFKSKKKTVVQENFGTEVAKTLFLQIEQARDEAKAGGIVDEKVFNDRLNSMYVAGYLIGYVNTHISRFIDEAEDIIKKQQAESIFETMFPGAGMAFVKGRLALRTKAKTLTTDDSNYAEVAASCHAFDTGMAQAEEEVDTAQEESGFQPLKLKEFLLLGEF